MPKTLDVLIGVSVIMLVVSMTVTILTQFLTTLFNTRGRGLKKGLATLVAQIDPRLKDSAGRIAGAVLMNPLIAEPMSRLGTVIHRDELVRLLLELAAGQGQIKLSDEDKKALNDALVENGIANPAATLGHLRLVAMQIEAARPDLATNVCRDFAILQGARSTFVGKINGWFDQTIDRVSARFTMGARGITFACALVVAFGLQLDTVSIVNTLWLNDALRERLVTEAGAVENPSSTDASGNAGAVANPQVVYLDQLATYGLITIPSPGSWRAELYPIKVPGILLSALLLSLGAPFWYGALKNLLRMRTVMAEKDDLQRISRQTTDASLAPPPPTPEHSEPPAAHA